MPSGLKDSSLASQHPKVQDVDQAQHNDGEWSFLAGLETNTHELGTHINDQKPVSPTSSSTKPIDERALDSDEENKPEQWMPQDQQPSLVYRNDDMDNPPQKGRRSQSGFRISSLNPFTSNTVQFHSSSSSSSSSTSLHKSGTHTSQCAIWIQLQYACLSLISSYLLAIKQAERSFKF